MGSPRPSYCILGFPDDRGVTSAGGRAGASGGPGAFRQMLKHFSGREHVREQLAADIDFPSGASSLAQTHRNATTFIAEQHSQHRWSIVVGGGSDFGYAQLRGIYESLGSRLSHRPVIGCLNVDAHLDCNPTVEACNAYSPFYTAIEECWIDPGQLVQFGAQRHCNPRAAWEFAEARNCVVVLFDELRTHDDVVSLFAQNLHHLAAYCDVVTVQLDLDSIAQAFAPGVSDPQSEGLAPRDIVEMMRIAGRTAAVESLGIFELNPRFDVDNRTARLAATAAYYFIAERLAHPQAVIE
ncbi:MAG: arginase family protein [Myxococcales bacterium]|nr:arginase family protein [Myxococcales bacterium]